MDIIYKNLSKLKIRPKAEKDLKPIKVAFIGKPNVGKSSLFNKIIGEDRVIVSPMAHTTRIMGSKLRTHRLTVATIARLMALQ